jgi:hypothetical protein
MGLTEQQIQYIDHRLENEGVKYWDIRIEMLDHVVSDVEKRIDGGENFNDAIKNSFIFLGHNGSFEDLIKNRQKLYQKLNNKSFIKEFKLFFTSFKSLFSFILIMLISYLFQDEKSVIKILIASSMIAFLLVTIFSLIHSKKVFKSASLLANFNFLTISLSLFNCFIFFPKVFMDIEKLSNTYLALVVVIIYPFFYVSYKNFFKGYKKINATYLKLIKE